MATRRRTHDAAAIYQVTLTWLRPGETLRRLRADVFALLGTIAESVTDVHQEVTADAVIYDVCTGMLEGDSAFAPHGHLIRLTIAR